MTDDEIINAGMAAFLAATRTEKAGGGPAGYKYMLARIAYMLAEDCGVESAVVVFHGISRKLNDACLEGE
ncbi:MAG: hypothetical protein AB1832_06240 [Pseudomonadota bacterium]